MRILSASGVHPVRLVVLSFASVILLGTALLMLPAATVSGQGLSLVDALFTAASATCVTGLTVVDTGSTLSRFGQVVVLVCLQIGGLGLMSFTTLLVVAVRQRLPATERTVIQQSFHHSPSRQIGTLVKYIVWATVLLEATGAMVLSARWLAMRRFSTVADTLYHAVFHAVSAFCNAGFSLYPDSLMGFGHDPVVQLVITTLIVAGGLGFLVGLDLTQYVQQAGRVVWQRWRAPRDTIRRPRLSVHGRLVLTTSAVLLGIGTLAYYGLERHGVLAGMSPLAALMNAYFCAVTARTAGFNTVSYQDMTGAALLCTMILMLIGASPGSTGGGIKTTSFAILVAFGVSRWRGQAHLHAFRRSIAPESLDKASAVTLASVALVVGAASALVVTETYGISPLEGQARVLPLVFETISAFGTVGLSMGATPMLTPAGKLLVSLVMFAGRIGPLTLALAIGARRRPERYQYAEEAVMVG